ncbi:ABC transporter ATP-binding protein [Stackebrandtia nassauensis]|uniref:ABC transporter related protein n=1 Tax=Stackebrandtia nassauensis (strain DSM 44728 / CIP 108903 / NRRL B-16338 / NBRC 102104 / LLR-40K-21) TaxID=446470 RepID=D3PWW0_STANL|nr:ABC transporter ATP-binding protein [Stackebrandtia nassauensis]ADD45184.1 ABC transporter related protein [Stackebrandtia nassauensis DSM 44728]
MNETVLSGTGLAKSFGSTLALAGVDFGVQRAEAVAIMGPSGSGKSTLLHCLAGIMRPDAGEVRLLDQRIDTMSEAQRSRLRRTRFGFLFQFGQLLPELTAVENVALPLMLGGTGKSTALREAHQWFPNLGLTGLDKRRPGELSGGQAQRVALARALVSGPAVVFADEPTGALDQATGTETMRTLVASTKGQRASLIVVTHDASVAAHCDRTIEIRDGLVTSDTSRPAPVEALAPSGSGQPASTTSPIPGSVPGRAGAW